MPYLEQQLKLKSPLHELYNTPKSLCKINLPSAQATQASSMGTGEASPCLCFPKSFVRTLLSEIPPGDAVFLLFIILGGRGNPIGFHLALPTKTALLHQPEGQLRGVSQMPNMSSPIMNSRTKKITRARVCRLLHPL